MHVIIRKHRFHFGYSFAFRMQARGYLKSLKSRAIVTQFYVTNE